MAVGLTVGLAACGGAPAAAPPQKLHVGLTASFARVGGGALWVTDRSGNRFVKVDPEAGRVKARIAVADEPFGIAYGAGSVWVGARYGSSVSRFNARTDHRQARIRIVRPCPAEISSLSPLLRRSL